MQAEAKVDSIDQLAAATAQYSPPPPPPAMPAQPDHQHQQLLAAQQQHHQQLLHAQLAHQHYAAQQAAMAAHQHQQQQLAMSAPHSYEASLAFAHRPPSGLSSSSASSPLPAHALAGVRVHATANGYPHGSQAELMDWSTVTAAPALHRGPQLRCLDVGHRHCGEELGNCKSRPEALWSPSLPPQCFSPLTSSSAAPNTFAFPGLYANSLCKQTPQLFSPHVAVANLYSRPALAPYDANYTTADYYQLQQQQQPHPVDSEEEEGCLDDPVNGGGGTLTDLLSAATNINAASLRKAKSKSAKLRASDGASKTKRTPDEEPLKRKRKQAPLETAEQLEGEGMVDSTAEAPVAKGAKVRRADRPPKVATEDPAAPSPKSKPLAAVPSSPLSTASAPVPGSMPSPLQTSSKARQTRTSQLASSHEFVDELAQAIAQAAADAKRAKKAHAHDDHPHTPGTTAATPATVVDVVMAEARVRVKGDSSRVVLPSANSAAVLAAAMNAEAMGRGGEIKREEEPPLTVVALEAAPPVESVVAESSAMGDSWSVEPGPLSEPEALVKLEILLPIEALPTTATTIATPTIEPLPTPTEPAIEPPSKSAAAKRSHKRRATSSALAPTPKVAASSSKRPSRSNSPSTPTAPPAPQEERKDAAVATNGDFAMQDTDATTELTAEQSRQAELKRAAKADEKYIAQYLTLYESSQSFASNTGRTRHQVSANASPAETVVKKGARSNRAPREKEFNPNTVIRQIRNDMKALAAQQAKATNEQQQQQGKAAADSDADGSTSAAAVAADSATTPVTASPAGSVASRKSTRSQGGAAAMDVDSGDVKEHSTEVTSNDLSRASKPRDRSKSRQPAAAEEESSSSDSDDSDDTSEEEVDPRPRKRLSELDRLHQLNQHVFFLEERSLKLQRKQQRKLAAAQAAAGTAVTPASASTAAAAVATPAPIPAAAPSSLPPAAPTADQIAAAAKKAAKAAAKKEADRFRKR